MGVKTRPKILRKMRVPSNFVGPQGQASQFWLPVLGFRPLGVWGE